MLPFFKVNVIDDDNDISGIDFNSWVDVPAHMKPFNAFNQDDTATKSVFSADKEKRLVTGVMISANTPIYRNFPEPSFWVFTPEVIEVIRKKFFKNGFIQNLNSQHDSKQILKGATLVDSYIASNSNPNLPNFPQAFEGLNLQDGTWIATYHVHDDKLWSEVLSGKWGGFSVEGWFDLLPLKLNSKFSKSNTMSKPKSIFSRIFGEKAKFATATTSEGNTLSYEGELTEGTAVFIESEEGQLPAPAGSYQVTLEDGAIKLIDVNENGMVTSVEDFVEEEIIEETVEDFKNDVAETFQALRNEFKEALASKDATIEELRQEIAELKTLNNGGKFSAQPKKVEGTEKMTVSQLLKNAK